MSDRPASARGARQTPRAPLRALVALARVDAEEHTVSTTFGAELEYDVLVVATGAVPVPAVPGAFTYRRPADSGALARASVRADVVVALPRLEGHASPGSGATAP